MVLKGYQVLTMSGEDEVFLSKLNTLYKYEIAKNYLTVVYKFKTDFFTQISKVFNPLRRFFRKDIRYAIISKQNELVMVKEGVIYTLKISNGEILSEIKIPKGVRPLNFLKIKDLENFDEGLYFGEYFDNDEKEAVRIFKKGENSLDEVYCFKPGSIYHIHNLIEDKNRGCVWILTGDFGNEAAIFQAFDNFKRIECVVRGQQVFRSCVAFPVAEGLLYATDSQFEQNSIRLLKQNNQVWESIYVADLNGPCIFGSSIGDQYYFSTSVEAINSGGRIQKFLRNKRGPGIIENHSEIVGGNCNKGFKTIYTNKKDFLPFILFQFGNILFPSGENKTKKIIFTPIALKKNDFNTLIGEHEI
jgi:hypothetical protein